LKDRGSKISGLLFFLILCGGIIYMMLTGTHSNENDRYEAIEIKGNKLLSENEYLSFSEFTDTTIYFELTLAEVKTKLDEHPYVNKSEVRFDGIKSIVVELEEKKPKALVLNKNKFNLITETSELLPVFNKSLLVELPIISNLQKQDEKLIDEEELNSAFRIIDAVKTIDENMFKSLAEINLRNGGDILIMFTGLQFPIVFGKKNEVRKILSLKSIWNDLLKESEVIFNIEYIDLRYNNKIFIGKRKSTELTG
jgi:cell division septal protein FtsQ